LIRLRTLGAIALTRSDDTKITTVLSQPKRLALLIYLAVANRGALCRRDTVLGVFWPEFDQERARAALRKALHFLRRELGEGVIVGRGDEEIGVDPLILRCDIHEFDSAVDRGELSKALAVYGGAFLDGFYLSQHPDFDQWAENVRSHYHDRALDAARNLTRGAVARGEVDDALRWARTWTRLAPQDEEATRTHMALLTDAGHRAAGFAAYEAYVEQMKDLELEPSAELRALAAEIGATGATERSNPAFVSPSVGDGPRSHRRGRVIAWLTGITAVSAGVMFIAFRISQTATAADGAVGRHVVAVPPFTNLSGDSTIDYLGEVFGRTAATAAAELTDVEVKPFGADSASATLSVAGSFLRAGDSVEVRLEVMNRRLGRTLPAPEPIRAPLTHPSALIDRLRSQVKGAVAHYAIRLGESRCYTRPPPSFEALAAFQAGWPGTFTDVPPATEARALLADALALEPTYTEAWYGIAETFGQVYWVPWDSLAREMRGAIDRLTPLDQSVLGLFDASGQLHLTAALAHRVRIAQCLPDAWIGVARLAFWTGHFDLAVKAFGYVDDRPWLTGLPEYWGAHASALHQLGDYEAELRTFDEAARRGEPGNQDRFHFIGDWPLRPKIALGDVAAAQEYIRHDDSGAVGIFALEMRAHGLVDESRKLLEQAVQRYFSNPDDPGDPTFARQRQRLRQDVGYALQLLDRSDEAIALLEPWARQEMATISDLIERISRPMEDPVNRVLGGRSSPLVNRSETWTRLRQPLSLLEHLGMAYARHGDRAAAVRIADQFAALNEDDLIFPYVPDLYRARIYSLLGDREDAVKLLRRAFVKGLAFYPNFLPAQDQIFWHVDPAFEPLHGYVPYEELVAPQPWHLPE
jgi:DNA-binding SARP family transcriptional activator/tetratricopeptide (TPR) repeat protein